MKKQLTLKKQTIANLTQSAKSGQNQRICPTPMSIVTLTHDLTWW
jgi:hypothetical protein